MYTIQTDGSHFVFASETVAAKVAMQLARQGLIVTVVFTEVVKK